MRQSYIGTPGDYLNQINPFPGSAFICRSALARETGEGAAQPRVRVLSRASGTDQEGKLSHYPFPGFLDDSPGRVLSAGLTRVVSGEPGMAIPV